jgi:cytochrome d ubiquinol oxidase subunit II
MISKELCGGQAMSFSYSMSAAYPWAIVANGWPFYMVALTFASAFGTLAISFWPYMIPCTIAIDDAAAPHPGLAFMFRGAGLFIFPLMLIYTVISYWIFRGKVRTAVGHD